MFAQERHVTIKKLVRKHRRINFAELQRLVDVSPATLRRDLTELESAGDLIRVHGGVLDPAYVRAEVSFDDRVLRNSRAKQAIAQIAAGFIPPGASVMIDAGSTCLETAKILLRRKDVRIITNSVTLLEAGLRGEAEVLCVGGVLRKVSAALTGGETLGAIALLHADYTVLGASGLDPAGGCTTTELSEAAIKRAMIAGAGRTILVADATKWRHPSTVRFAVWNQIHEWVTDQKPADPELDLLAQSGVTIHAAASLRSPDRAIVPVG